MDLHEIICTEKYKLVRILLFLNQSPMKKLYLKYNLIWILIFLFQVKKIQTTP